MPIQQSEVKMYKSASGVGLGGAIDLGSVITSGLLNNIFDDVASIEATAGATEYRCVYIRNTNTAIDLLSAGVQIKVDTVNPTTKLAIGLGSAGINAVEQTVPDEVTAPSGVTFTDVIDDKVIAGTLTANGSYFALWIRRTVDALAQSSTDDASSLRISGDTAS